MKILYGVQSFGNGHMARARILTPKLLEAGFEIDFVFSGRDNSNYFDMDMFGDNYRCFPGFSIAFERGKVSDIDTFKKNKHLQFCYDTSKLDLKPYDFILTDNEPVSAWAALLKGKKSIAISNQCSYKYKIPKYPGFLPSKMLIDYMAPGRHEVGLHWHHFNQPLLPPLLEDMEIGESDPNFFLVYMYVEAVDDIVEFLKPFTDHRFAVYASVPETIDHGHIQIKPFSYEGFNSDFQKAQGVISNAGFELSSECLASGKRLLVKPLKGQVEQLSNALALQKLQRATVIDSLDHGVLKEWLTGDSHTPIIYPDVAEAFAGWLKNSDWKDIRALSDPLWEKTQNLPDYVDDKSRKIEYNRII